MGYNNTISKVFVLNKSQWGELYKNGFQSKDMGSYNPHNIFTYGRGENNKRK